MILVIRISGLVEVPENIEEALFRLRLRRKYSGVLLKPSPENIKLLKKIRDYIAYGDIDKETLSLLLTKRAKPINKRIKLDIDKILNQLENKDLTSLGIKPFFRLHSPRGGIDSKIHFPIKKGILGDNKSKINELVRRML